MGIKSVISAMTLKTKIIVICAAVAVVGGVGAVLGIALNKEEAYRVIKVFEMTGEAVVTRAGTGDLDAYVGMNLESGDTLTVGEDSTLRISMDSDKYVLLDGGTVLELTATGSSSDSRTVINLKQGTILNELTNPLSANSSYEVSTPKSTMAVRGTSFIVSVEEQSDGSFITTESTLQGKVEVELLDKDGNPTGKTALVTPDTSVTILTEPDATSGNPADEDGTSSFVKEGEDGSLVPVGEDESPLHNINYDNIPDSLRSSAIRSNDENLMLLNDTVITKLRGEEDPEVTTTAETTTAPVTEPTTETEVTTVPTEVTYPEETTTVTTVPEETTVTTVVTTVPTETTTEVTVPTETTVPEETTRKPSTPSSTTTEETTTTPAVETYQVILKNDDGTIIDTIDVEDRGTYTLPTPPTGNRWRLNDTDVYESAGYEGTYDQRLYGDSVTYTAVEAYDITVNLTGGGVSGFTAEKDTEILSILNSKWPRPELGGYTRIGWVFEDGTEITASTVVTGAVTVKEVSAETITITFSSEDGGYTRTCAKGYSLSDFGLDVPAIPEKTGCIGVWSKDGGETEFTASTVIPSDYEFSSYNPLYLCYMVDITFNFANGTTESHRIGENTSFDQNGLTFPTPDADDFCEAIGWINSSNEIVDEDTVFSRSEMITVKQEGLTYNVTFNLTIDLGYGSSTSDSETVYSAENYETIGDLFADNVNIGTGTVTSYKVNGETVSSDATVGTILRNIIGNTQQTSFTVDVEVTAG
ncbi:MAG: FecR domain-containing protein [Oscillospiraceae bacterium]